MSSSWDHTQKSIDELMRSEKFFKDEQTAIDYMNRHGLHASIVTHINPLDGSQLYTLQHLPMPNVAEPFDAPKHMTMGEYMKQNVMPTSFGEYFKTGDDDDKEEAFTKMAQNLKDIVRNTPLTSALDSTRRAFENATVDVTADPALNQKAIKERSEFLIQLSQLPLDDALRINPDTLLKATMESCHFDSIMAEAFFKLNRQPTQNAIHRTIDFMLSTTQTADYVSSFEDELEPTQPRKHRYLQQIDKMLNELNNLVFVSKARMIMDDFPESISLSVQLLPSISEDDTGYAMQEFESILQNYKPKNLIELEVSITNKVVY